jgi:hypothetical protein
MNNQDNTNPQDISRYKTPEHRLISCRKANKKYYEKNKEEIKKKVLERYYERKRNLERSSPVG